MISIDRLPTKEFLIRIGVQICQLERGCSWCKREPENVEHLFFQCKFIEVFWRKFFEWWDVEWNPVDGFLDFYSLCNNVKFIGVCKSLWLISVTATCWSVWLARNEMVFERKWSTTNNLLFHSKMRALMWVRSVQEELRVQERSWWICPYRSWCDLKKSGMGGMFWCPPRYGWVKFNVSGVANEDEVECGGVLRDLDGVARALFSGLVAAKDSITAEVGAIIIALDVYLAMGWKGKGSLIIEIGSNEDIENRMIRVGNVSFLKAEKHGNEMAYALALAGIKRPGMFKAWW
ncbi:hypothetical protein Goarm_001432 [Gossypium armourianum]|uniref:Reverse transcriptase zinc-binding domain-containing protein n=1 Tax=Gossypium armourianum TaxID=34283 RepID=A0A7J9KD68_9ROSI|nr:hypothetical protein [Gossypium armourianum]